MEYKILESTGVEIDHIDGAAFNWFSANRTNGILKGVLNECSVYTLNSSTIEVSTGVILMSGFRIKLTAPIEVRRTASSSLISHHTIARVTLYTDRKVSFDIETRVIEPLVQEDLFKTESGVYEVELLSFKTSPTGLSDVTRSLPVISGGSADVDQFVQLAREQAIIASQQASIAIDRAKTVLSLTPDVLGVANGINFTPSYVRFNTERAVVAVVFLLLDGELSVASPIVLPPTLITSGTPSISSLLLFHIGSSVVESKVTFTIDPAVSEDGFSSLSIQATSSRGGTMRAILYGSGDYAI